jgi:hypothetical protein
MLCHQRLGRLMRSRQILPRLLVTTTRGLQSLSCTGRQYIPNPREPLHSECRFRWFTEDGPRTPNRTSAAGAFPGALTLISGKRRLQNWASFLRRQAAHLRAARGQIFVRQTSNCGCAMRDLVDFKATRPKISMVAYG